MRYWWVNQNQTYKHEVQGGFLWSPKRNKAGRRNPFYDNMAQVEAGDLILSFCDTMIKAVGVAQGPAESAGKPNFGSIGDQWSDDGWFVPVEFQLAETPVKPKDFIAELAAHLEPKYAPLQANGNGNQGVYLAEISEPFAAIILDKLGLSIAAFVNGEPSDDAVQAGDEVAQQALQGRTDIGPTQKEQLILSRRGQGIFRSNVRLNETACRLTGVSDPQFLIASHIKPWRHCSDLEKLDGCNGLLLSPHVDKLFDRGLISFMDDGTVLKSIRLPSDVWAAWGFDAIVNVGGFSAEQAAYLAYHRTDVFKQGDGA
ncbi:HNH endonuclease [Sphingomonas crocodyli]|uniref:HNH endonuclease n=1 Tax=Sphingomonas crocodyli TaxID=1979270 RepID=A0A437M7F2_9SPHN|nr:HNH endonuclease signature motif containing protein [Sphingomonas crocodyli]RVT93476.1 HNH endonuclease [Sphingomonas crocodyli]